MHVDDCVHLEKYRHQPDQYLALRWEENTKGDFPVDLHVDILNQRGSLASLALAISNAESNIESIRAEEFDGRFFAVNITIAVRNRIHLARIMRSIRKARNVTHVMRYRELGLRVK